MHKKLIIWHCMKKLVIRESSNHIFKERSSPNSRLYCCITLAHTWSSIKYFLMYQVLCMQFRPKKVKQREEESRNGVSWLTLCNSICDLWKTLLATLISPAVQCRIPVCYILTCLIYSNLSPTYIIHGSLLLQLKINHIRHMHWIWSMWCFCLNYI